LEIQLIAILIFFDSHSLLALEQISIFVLSVAVGPIKQGGLSDWLLGSMPSEWLQEFKKICGKDGHFRK
jgi:hypothetical protein